MNEARSGGGGVPLLFLLFLALKLTDVIDWSWWWVTAPLWAPAAIAVAFFVLMFLASLLSGGRR